MARIITLLLLPVCGAAPDRRDDISWRQQRGDTTRAAPTTETTFRWSYYPTHDTMRFAVFNAPPAATRWSLSLSHAPGAPAASGELVQQGAVLAQTNGTMPIPASGQNWAIPTLAAGKYTVTLALTKTAAAADAAAAVLFTQTDTLNRTIRPWEGNSLGMNDILIPPFTALTVSDKAGGAGTKVGVIARELTLTDLGLWRSISISPAATPRDPKPDAIEILAKPIELVAKIAGKSIVATGSSVKVTKSTPTVVKTASSWTAGALMMGSLDTHYDPDGCMRVRILDGVCTGFQTFTDFH
jgi:hypothetical protein